MQALKAEVQKSGASSSEDLDEHTKEKSIAKMKKDIEWEFSKVHGLIWMHAETVKAKEQRLSLEKQARVLAHRRRRRRRSLGLCGLSLVYAVIILFK